MACPSTRAPAMIEAALAIPPATWLALVLATWALNLTPGSDVMFITASGAAGGTRAAVAAALGISAASLFHVGLAVLGVASLIAASDTALAVLRWGGAAYLVWLAVQLWRAPPPPARPGAAAIRRAFLRGAVNNILNPKVSIFVLAFLPQFADPARGPAWAQILALGIVFALVSVPVNVGWALVAGTLGGHLRRFGRGMNRLAATLLAGLAARLAWS
jgi:threonine/homoserine/homoserine lactone efflux protein